MYGRKRSVPLEALLRCLAAAYGAVVRLRIILYRAGLFRTKRLSVPVLSVGNITLGGTGKTPTVIALARFCQERGKRPAIVSRGYGRSDESSVLIVSDGEGTILGPDAAGDEPAMLSRRLTGIPVVVGSDRVRAGQAAIDRFKPDLLILDDGFQHVRLHRDLNIALVDGADPFGSGALFPAGILREPRTALRRADLLVITRSDRAPDVDGLKDAIGGLTAAAIVTAAYRPTELVEIATGRTRSLDVLRNASVLAFAGIARPDSLEALLGSLGADIVSLRTYPDHHRYTHTDLKVLLQDAARTAALPVTTEKDGVKLKGMAPAGIWMLRVDLAINEPAVWEEAVCRVI